MSNVLKVKNNKGEWVDIPYIKGAQGPQGIGISNIQLLSSVGKINTYRMTFTDGTYFDYDVKDGADGNSGSGSGDMAKSVYDANNNGTVDNAEKVNGHTVLSDVPADAKFTDTVYDDTEIRNKLDKLPENPITSEKDPTVPAWAKEANKPTYTAKEVGAMPASAVVTAFWSGTQTEYDALGSYNNTTLYLITEE